MHISIDWIEADARDYAYAPCSVVTLNFTLQFIPIEERLALLTRLAEAMVPGGCLILAEKPVFKNRRVSKFSPTFIMTSSAPMAIAN